MTFFVRAERLAASIRPERELAHIIGEGVWLRRVASVARSGLI